jgi:hypothetical protein
MAVYKANLNRLRKQMKARSQRMSEAIRDAQARIRKGENVAQNRTTLARAKRVQAALDSAIVTLKSACCNNDLNCDPQTF